LPGELLVTTENHPWKIKNRRDDSRRFGHVEMSAIVEVKVLRS
jgi:hypothetical protein